MHSEAAIRKPLEIVNSDNWTYEAAGYYLPQKRALFFAFYKTHANTQQVLPVQTGLYRYDK